MIQPHQGLPDIAGRSVSCQSGNKSLHQMEAFWVGASVSPWESQQPGEHGVPGALWFMHTCKVTAAMGRRRLITVLLAEMLSHDRCLPQPTVPGCKEAKGPGCSQQSSPFMVTPLEGWCQNRLLHPALLQTPRTYSCVLKVLSIVGPVHC